MPKNIIDDEKTGDIDLTAIKDALEQESPRKRLVSSLTITATTIIAAIATTLGVFQSSTEQNKKTRERAAAIIEQTHELSFMKNELAKIRDEVRKFPDKSISNNLSIVIRRIESLDDRLTLLEKAIEANPEKALAIPMMRKDMELSQTKFENSLQIVSKDVERIDSYFKYIFTAIGSALFAVVGLFAKSDSLRKSLLDALTKSVR